MVRAQIEVEIYEVRANGTWEHLTVIGAGNYFGELGPILNLPWQACARAQGSARLTRTPCRTSVSDFPRK